MLKRLEMALLALKIEFHWLLIVKKRKTGTQMLDSGIPVISPQMLHLSNSLNKHINLAEAARKRYAGDSGGSDARRPRRRLDQGHHDRGHERRRARALHLRQRNRLAGIKKDNL